MKIYILVKDGNYVREVNLAEEYPNISFPSNVSDDQLPEDVYCCTIQPKPYNPVAHFTQNAPSLNDGNWVITWTQVPVMPEDIDRLKQTTLDNIRLRRDGLMAAFDWRYLRYDRETRMNLMPTDDITKLDEYMQALADITKQEDIFNIQWPIEP